MIAPSGTEAVGKDGRETDTNGAPSMLMNTRPSSVETHSLYDVSTISLPTTTSLMAMLASCPGNGVQLLVST
jgi:hypothetical protein